MLFVIINKVIMTGLDRSKNRGQETSKEEGERYGMY